MQFMLLALAAVMASVSAMTLNLPLYSRATEPAARGSTKFHLPVSAIQPDSGVNVPVTDWFSRTDNQVSMPEWLSPSWNELADILSQWYTTFAVGTPPQDL